MSLLKNAKMFSSLLIVALQLSTFAADSGNFQVAKPILSTEEDGPQIKIMFSVEDKGCYYISFAMYGNFEEMYNVLIDGRNKGYLYLNSNGLQNAFLQKAGGSLDDKVFDLKKGSHTITVLGNSKYQVPNVLEIKVGKTVEKLTYHFDKLTDHILESPVKEQVNLGVMSSAISTDPYYKYNIEGGVSFAGNTYCVDWYFYEGNTVEIAVNRVSGYMPTIYLFKREYTGNYTWTAYGGVSGATGVLTQKIPITNPNEPTATGYYRCVILGERSEGETVVTCKVNGVTQSVNSACPVRFGKRKIFYRNGNTGTNFFTTTNNGGNGDPFMYILNESNCIVTWNDDAYNNDLYRMDSKTYDQNLWQLHGVNSLCKWSGATSAQYVTVLLFSFYNSGTGTADLYGFVENGQKSYNMLSSASTATRYNCFAWSGGITSTVIDPTTSPSPYYYGTNDDTQAFNNYYGNRKTDGSLCERYAGAMTFIPCDGNDPQACVDLWGYYDNCSISQMCRGSIRFTHATVSKNANSQFHGYSWESKEFDNQNGNNLPRYFHPREYFSLGGGNVRLSYKPKLTSSITALATQSSGITSAETAEHSNIEFASTPKMKAMGINHPLSFEESVKLGLTVMRNASFTNAESEKIDKLVAAVSEDISSEYPKMLSAYEKSLNEYSLTNISDVKMIDKSKEKRNLKEFYKKHGKKLWPLIIKMVKERQLDKEFVLEDAMSCIPLGNAIMYEINGELSVSQYTDDGALIVTSSEDRYIMICKQMLNQM